MLLMQFILSSEETHLLNSILELGIQFSLFMLDPSV